MISPSVSRRSKYNNKKTIVDGITFDSKAEAARYGDLKIRQNAGMISNLELQPEYILQIRFRRKGKVVRAIKYRADFRYVRRGESVVEDVKGLRTKEYQIKKKMFLLQYPEIVFIEVYKGQEIIF